MSMNAWQEPVRAADLPPQELASVRRVGPGDGCYCGSVQHARQLPGRASGSKETGSSQLLNRD